MTFRTCLLFCLFFAVGFPRDAGAELTIDSYRKALWMTTRMYGGQRSGAGPNWLVMDHGAGVDFTGDADNGYSLAGGWHDCGDHVKFGQTLFYSAYVLLKAYAEFPAGFDDHYSFDYRGYRAAGDFSWEGARGAPNGIPDILDEVKYAADYFMRCARDASTFYYQAGEGSKDHKQWVTSVKMATLAQDDGGQPRAVFKNPPDASMASFCGATLALMSRVYRKFDSAYSDRCLSHAYHVYEYAKANPGTAGSPDGEFYPANARWEDDFICAATELYFATGDTRYRDEALALADRVGDHYWSLCYNNNDDLALYNLSLLGSAAKRIQLQDLVQRYKNNVTAAGVGATGSEWGILRYSVGQAFAAALNAKIQGAVAVDPFVRATIEYVLGNNSAGQSFVAGFGDKSPVHHHHRNVYLDDRNVPDDEKNNLVIPARNRQHGYLVGGTLDPGAYIDDINQYRYTEGGIDYNCGLVGALGYLLSMIAPVDTTRFGVQTKMRDGHSSMYRVLTEPARCVIVCDRAGMRFSGFAFTGMDFPPVFANGRAAGQIIPASSGCRRQKMNF